MHEQVHVHQGDAARVTRARRRKPPAVQHDREDGAAQPLLSLQQSAGNLAVQSLVQREDHAPTAVRARSQATARRRQPAAQAVAPVEGGLIQRHSSWEHQLLGDAKPDDLSKLGTWQDLMEQTKLEGVYGFRKPKNEMATVNLDLGQKGKVAVTKGNVMHILAQYLQSLSDWQDNPPQQDSGGKVDPKYQTVLVSIPGGKPDGSPLIITYGEMNTLADYYGNLDVMKSADKGKRWMVVQSVRQETFFRLKDIYTQLDDSLTGTEKKDADVKSAQDMTKGNKRFNQKLGYKFAGAMAPDYVSGKAGQIDLLKLGGAGGTGTNEYAATLGRNACHFVPESWHAWSSYHQKAREEAKLAADATAKADALQDGQKVKPDPEVDKQIGELRQQASQHTNEALISNGFGDHYLQDSYAAGHMINKTQIMQWFVQWLDKNKYTMDFATDATWQRIQAIAYRQPEIASKIQYDKTQVQGAGPGQKKNRARNPQAVEDIGGNDWQKRFEAAGLSVPASLRTPGSPTRQIVEWWQVETAGGGSREQTGQDLLLNSGKLSFAELTQALTDLQADGVVSRVGRDADVTGQKYMSGALKLNPAMSTMQFAALKFSLRQDYVPRDAKWFKMVQGSTKAGNDASYQKMAAAVTYQDYFAFMNAGYLQKSTNALHDVFCKKGLDVSSAEGEEVFKVYGDDSMFSSQSAKGVKHSGETAHMSSQAIVDIAEGRAPKQSTADILARLPNRVRPEGMSDSVGIEAWHNPAAKDLLRNFCETTVFPEMGLLDKAVGAMGDLSDFISKDYNPPHGGDAF